jgi:hypothetical protein
MVYGRQILILGIYTGVQRPGRDCVGAVVSGWGPAWGTALPVGPAWAAHQTWCFKFLGHRHESTGNNWLIRSLETKTYGLSESIVHEVTRIRVTGESYHYRLIETHACSTPHRKPGAPPAGSNGSVWAWRRGHWCIRPRLMAVSEMNME